MAIGDILSGTIHPNGRWLTLVIEGLQTPGVLNMGWTPSQDPDRISTPTVKLVVTSLGFQNGVATTRQRTVYATTIQRQVFPNQGLNELTYSGGNLTMVLRLNKKIYAKDKAGAGNSGTDVSCTVLSNLYSQGGNSVVGRTFNLVNNSTVPYPKVVANWSIVGGQLMHGSSFPLKITAFSKHYQNGEAIDCAEFTMSEGANSTTLKTCQSFIDRTSPDRTPVIEYGVDMPLAAFTQGALCTANFKAYPFIGDTASILDTTVGGVAWPHASYGPRPFVCDKNGTYGQSVAVVDSTTGNDATGVAADITNLAAANAAPFLTIARAAVAITARNTAQYARGDCGAGIVYLKAGNHAWLGAANTGIGTTPNTWLTVTPYPGVTRAQAVIASYLTTGTLSGRVKLDNVTITVATANTFTNIAAIWLNNVDLNTSGTIFNTTNGWQFMTFGKVTLSSAQGLRQNSSTGSPFAMVRGVDLPSFNRTINGYMVIGCHKYGRITPASVLVSTSLASINATPADTLGNWIVAFNRFTGLETPTVMFECGVNLPTSNGAFVQNLFEACGTQANALADIGSSDGTTTNTPHVNFIVQHNTMVGNRCFIGYNDLGTVLKEKLDWSFGGNYWDRPATKDDTHSPGNAARTGNWEVTSGTDFQGNYHSVNMISGSSFPFEWVGTSSHQPSSTGTAAEAQFFDRESATEIAGVLTAGAGDGDYRIPPTSPLTGRLVNCMCRWDIEGKPRPVRGASGAYAVRNPAIGRSLAFA
jgi:hypothetical protein